MYTKNKLLLLLALLCFSKAATAQQSEGLSYQAALRNGNNPVAGKTVNLQFTISDDSATGTVVYKETQLATSTSLGVVNCMIGKGTATTGTWKNIKWNHSPMYVNVQADTSGGTSFVDLGSTQLGAASYAKSANGITIFQNGTTNPTQMIVSHSSAYPTWGIQYNDTLDAFEIVGGGVKSVSFSSWSGNITAYNAYPSGTYPFSSNPYGNIVAQGNITTGNKIQRGSDTTNMLPIAWATVSPTGTIYASSGNITLGSHTTGSGTYTFSITGESYYYQNFACVATLDGTLGFVQATSSGGYLYISTANTSGTLTDEYFQFVVYKK
ncbi:MAG: hypothetical protein ACTHJ0_11855 [Flavipsychrobacter sp.]